MIRVALDAMGGDDAPRTPVLGAIAAANEWPDIAIVLIGDERKIARIISGDRPSNVTVVHTEEVIGSDEEPVRAVRRKKAASLVKSCMLVKAGEADVAISAGNTGALMAAGLLALGRIRGIERPALAPVFPTIRERGMLVLDVGANMDAKPEQLAQYALMGSIYAKQVLQFPKPRVGLLNVGTEAAKGNSLTKAAYPLIEAQPLHFVGNIEARDVLSGVCDVLVCDGFVGNILLKSVEGVAGTFFSVLKEQMTRTLASKLAASVLRPGLSQFKNKMDYTEYGGAPLLGLNGAIVKSHGASNEKAIKNAIDYAQKFVRSQVIRRIRTNLKESERQ